LTIRSISLLSLLSALQGAVVIDRIAVVVDKHAIKLSDIHRDLAVTEFLNREPPDFSAAARQKAADRLIEQTIIREEIADGGYAWARESEADAMLDKLRQDRFGGVDARLQTALSPYGISVADLRAQLLWQLTVLQFIDERFRTGVLVSDEDVRAYYNGHLAELKRQYPRDSSFEALEAKIRDSLEGERVNQNFAEEMDQQRKSSRIRFIQGAFE
jgi:peptidyl-prolyl cis-trans isomerase SurA